MMDDIRTPTNLILIISTTMLQMLTMQVNSHCVRYVLFLPTDDNTGALFSIEIFRKYLSGYQKNAITWLQISPCRPYHLPCDPIR
jgi:hypothetical protein